MIAGWRWGRLRAAGALLAAAAGLPAWGATEPLWLVVGASDASAGGIAFKAQRLAESGAETGLVFRLRDCGEKRAGFGWAEAVQADRAAAQAALDRLQQRVPDAYLKRCVPREGSLLNLRMPAVDPSIAKVPATGVNWDDSDKVSSAVTLRPGLVVVLQRYYLHDESGPLEGRRVRVLLAKPGQQPVKLEDDCLDAESFAISGDAVAFQCVTEQAGDHLMHKVVVQSIETGERNRVVDRCRSPAFSTGRLTCRSEAVDARGRLRLRAIEIR